MNTCYCKKIDVTINLDGNYEKPVWKDMEELSLVDTMSGEKPRLKTFVKTAWNDEFLYVAFKCEDDFIKATMTKYNDEIFKEDVVEVFIDDDCDLKTYTEIEVSPINTLLHYVAFNNLKGNILLYQRKEKRIETAIHHYDDNGIWSAEIAIPFSEFIQASNVPPKHSDRWRVNFYRIDRAKMGEDEFTAWSPTVVRRFHTPQKFGELIFTI